MSDIAVNSRPSVPLDTVTTQPTASTTPELQAGFAAATTPAPRSTAESSGPQPHTSLSAHGPRPERHLGPTQLTCFQRFLVNVGIAQAQYPLNLVSTIQLGGSLSQLERNEVGCINQAVAHMTQGTLPHVSTVPEFRALPNALNSLAILHPSSSVAGTVQNNLLTLSALLQQSTGALSFSLAANYLTEMLEHSAGHLSNPEARRLLQEEIAPRLMGLLAQTTHEGADSLSAQIDELKQQLTQLIVGNGSGASILDLELASILQATISDVQALSAQKVEHSATTATSALAPKDYDFGFSVIGSKLEFDPATLQQLGSPLDTKVQDYRQCLEQALQLGSECLNAAQQGKIVASAQLLEQLQDINAPLADKLSARLAAAQNQFIDQVVAQVFDQEVKQIDVTRLASDGAYLSQTITRLTELRDESQMWPSALRERCLNQINTILAAQPDVAAAQIAPDAPPAQKLSMALDALSALLRTAALPISDATTFVTQFGVDSAHPLGTSKGGLLGLAQHLLAGTFIAPQGGSARSDLVTLEHIATQVGTALDATVPHLKDTLTALVDKIGTSTDYQAKINAFQALKATLLTVARAGDAATLSKLADALAGTATSNMSNAAGNAGSAGSTGNAAGTASNAASTALSALEQLFTKLQDSSGAQFNQALTQALKAHATDSELLQSLGTLAATVNECFIPGTELNSIKQNAQLASDLSVVARMPLVAEITQGLKANGANQSYDFWAHAKHSSNPLIRLTYQIVQELNTDPKPATLLKLNLCLSHLKAQDLEQLSSEYYEHCQQELRSDPNAGAKLQLISTQLAGQLGAQSAALTVAQEFKQVLTQAAYAMFAAGKGIPLNMQGQPKVAGQTEPGAHGANTEFYQLLEQQAQVVANELAQLPVSAEAQAARDQLVNEIKSSGAQDLSAEVGNEPLGKSAAGQLIRRMNCNTAVRIDADKIRALIDPSAPHYERLQRILTHAVAKAVTARVQAAQAQIARLTQEHKAISPELRTAAQEQVPQPQDYEEALALFRQDLSADPILRSLADQFSPDGAQQILQEHFAAQLDLLGLAPEQLQRISNYYPITDVTHIDTKQLLNQDGQTQGLMLYLVKEAVLQDFADMPPERMANLVPSARANGPVAPDHEWSVSELKEGLINALQLPLHQAEARAIAAKLYTETVKADVHAPAWQTLTPLQQQDALLQIFGGDDDFAYKRAALGALAQVQAQALTPEQRTAILNTCLDEALHHKKVGGGQTITGIPQDSKAKELAQGALSAGGGRALLTAIGSAGINLGLYAVMTAVHKDSLVRGLDRELTGVKAGSERAELLDKLPDKLDAGLKAKLSSPLTMAAGFLVNSLLAANDVPGQQAVKGMLLNMSRGDTQKGAHLRALLRLGFEDIAYLSGAEGLKDAIADYNNFATARVSLPNLERAMERDRTLADAIKALPGYDSGAPQHTGDKPRPPSVGVKELLPLMMARYMTASEGKSALSAPEARALSTHIVNTIAESPSLTKVVAGFVPNSMRSFNQQEWLQLIGHIMYREWDQIAADKSQKQVIEERALARALMNMDFDSALALQSNGSVSLFKLGIGVGASIGGESEQGAVKLEGKATMGAQAELSGALNWANALTLRRNEDGTFTLEVGKEFGIELHASAGGKLSISGALGRAQDEGKAEPSLQGEAGIGLEAVVNLGGSVGGSQSITISNAYDMALLLRRILAHKVQNSDLKNATTAFEGKLNAGFNIAGNASLGFALAGEFAAAKENKSEQNGVKTKTSDAVVTHSVEHSGKGTITLGGQELEYDYTDTTERSLGPVDPNSTQLGVQGDGSLELGGQGELSYRVEDNGPLRTISHHTQGQLTFKGQVNVQAAGYEVCSADKSKTLSQVDNYFSYTIDRIAKKITEATVETTYTFASAPDLKRLLLANQFTAAEADKLIEAIGADAFKDKRFTSITLQRSWNSNLKLDEDSQLSNLANYEVTGFSLHSESEQDQTPLVAKLLQNEAFTSIVDFSYERKSVMALDIPFDRAALDQSVQDLSVVLNTPFKFLATAADVAREMQHSDAYAQQQALQPQQP